MNNRETWEKIINSYFKIKNKKSTVTKEFNELIITKKIQKESFLNSLRMVEEYEENMDDEAMTLHFKPFENLFLNSEDKQVIKLIHSEEGRNKNLVIENSHERNPLIREKAIEIHGLKCQVCKMNFESKYGELGKGFIHVHHKKPISDGIREVTIKDIKKDYCVVCPNCHSMLHRNGLKSPDRLKEIIKNRKRK